MHVPRFSANIHTDSSMRPALWMCFHPLGVSLIVLFFWNICVFSGLVPRPHVHGEANISFSLELKKPFEE